MYINKHKSCIHLEYAYGYASTFAPKILQRRTHTQTHKSTCINKDQ